MYSHLLALSNLVETDTELLVTTSRPIILNKESLAAVWTRNLQTFSPRMFENYFAIGVVVKAPNWVEPNVSGKHNARLSEVVIFSMMKEKTANQIFLLVLSFSAPNLILTMLSAPVARAVRRSRQV